MGLRFRRSIRLFPGVRLNLSRSGISTSAGVRGAHVTIGKAGTRVSSGIPGTGLSYTEVLSSHPHAPAPEPLDADMPAPRGWFRWWMVPIGLLALVGAANLVGIR